MHVPFAFNVLYDRTATNSRFAIKAMFAQSFNRGFVDALNMSCCILSL